LIAAVALASKIARMAWGIMPGMNATKSRPHRPHKGIHAGQNLLSQNW
jgi:hypothetical protein